MRAHCGWRVVTDRRCLPTNNLPRSAVHFLPRVRTRRSLTSQARLLRCLKTRHVCICLGLTQPILCQRVVGTGARCAATDIAFGVFAQDKAHAG